MATGNVTDTNIGKHSLGSTGNTCTGAGITRRLLTFPWRVLVLVVSVDHLFVSFFSFWPLNGFYKEV